MTAPASLALLVSQYEEAHAALRAESARLDQVGWPSNDHGEHTRLARLSGQLRGSIVRHQSAGMADVLLKARAFASDSTVALEREELFGEIDDRDGHAYTIDLAHAVAIDLMELEGFGQCA